MSYKKTRKNNSNAENNTKGYSFHDERLIYGQGDGAIRTIKFPLVGNPKDLQNIHSSIIEEHRFLIGISNLAEYNEWRSSLGILINNSFINDSLHFVKEPHSLLGLWVLSLASGIIFTKHEEVDYYKRVFFDKKSPFPSLRKELNNFISNKETKNFLKNWPTKNISKKIEIFFPDISNNLEKEQYYKDFITTFTEKAKNEYEREEAKGIFLFGKKFNKQSLRRKDNLSFLMDTNWSVSSLEKIDNILNEVIQHWVDIIVVSSFKDSFDSNTIKNILGIGERGNYVNTMFGRYLSYLQEGRVDLLIKYLKKYQELNKKEEAIARERLIILSNYAKEIPRSPLFAKTWRAYRKLINGILESWFSNRTKKTKQTIEDLKEVSIACGKISNFCKEANLYEEATSNAIPPDNSWENVYPKDHLGDKNIKLVNNEIKKNKTYIQRENIVNLCEEIIEDIKSLLGENEKIIKMIDASTEISLSVEEIKDIQKIQGVLKEQLNELRQSNEEMNDFLNKKISKLTLNSKTENSKNKNKTEAKEKSEAKKKSEAKEKSGKKEKPEEETTTLWKLVSKKIQSVPQFYCTVQKEIFERVYNAPSLVQDYLAKLSGIYNDNYVSNIKLKNNCAKIPISAERVEKIAVAYLYLEDEVIKNKVQPLIELLKINPEQDHKENHCYHVRPGSRGKTILDFNHVDIKSLFDKINLDDIYNHAKNNASDFKVIRDTAIASKALLSTLVEVMEDNLKLIKEVSTHHSNLSGLANLLSHETFITRYCLYETTNEKMALVTKEVPYTERIRGKKGKVKKNINESEKRIYPEDKKAILYSYAFYKNSESKDNNTSDKSSYENNGNQKNLSVFNFKTKANEEVSEKLNDAIQLDVRTSKYQLQFLEWHRRKPKTKKNDIKLSGPQVIAEEECHISWVDNKLVIAKDEKTPLYIAQPFNLFSDKNKDKDKDKDNTNVTSKAENYLGVDIGIFAQLFFSLIFDT